MKKFSTLILIAVLTLNSFGLLFSVPNLAYALTAPTLADYGQSQFHDTGFNDETASSVSWQTGDLILVLGYVADAITISLNTPTVSGLTFSLATTTTQPSNDTKVYLWTATAASNSSGAVQADGSNSNGQHMHGISVFVYRGTDGLGNMSVIGGSTGDTRSLTRGSDNSAVIFILADWNADPDVTVTATPASGATQHLATTTSAVSTEFVYSWTDQGAAGATSYGVSGFNGNDNSMIVAEITGTEEVEAPAVSGRVIRLTAGVRLMGGVRLR